MSDKDEPTMRQLIGAMWWYLLYGTDADKREIIRAVPLLWELAKTRLQLLDLEDEAEKDRGNPSGDH